MVEFIVERQLVNGIPKYGIVAYENGEYLSSIYIKKSEKNKFLLFLYSAKKLFASLLDDKATKRKYEIAVETLKQQYVADN